MTTTLTVQETGTTLTVASTLRMTASEAETLLDGVFEPVLGNPGTNGYVLSSTTAGVRSWVATASDVDGITTTTGSSTNMLRVAAAGGLEYRTTAQVLSDIGAAPTASPTFTGTMTTGTIVINNTTGLRPSANTAFWPIIQDAGGTTLVTMHTSSGLVLRWQYSIEALSSNGVGANLAVLYSNSIYIGPKSASASTTALETKLSAYKHIEFRTNGNSGSFVSAGRISATGLWRIGADEDATAYADIAASTTAAASLRIRSGTAPTTPNAGDLWFDGTNLKFYDGTTTRTLSWT